MRKPTRQALWVGLPMVAGIVAGSFFLKEFMKGKYEVIDMQGGPVSKKELAEQQKIKDARAAEEFDLEKELSKMNQQVDLTQWESKRVERPPGEE